jgi:hypothetical protein
MDWNRASLNVVPWQIWPTDLPGPRVLVTVSQTSADDRCRVLRVLFHGGGCASRMDIDRNFDFLPEA